MPLTYRDDDDMTIFMWIGALLLLYYISARGSVLALRPGSVVTVNVCKYDDVFVKHV